MLATGRADAANDGTSWFPEEQRDEAEDHGHAQPTELPPEGSGGNERQRDDKREHGQAHTCTSESVAPVHRVRR